MKVLFLDIDGVLNNRAFLTKQWEVKREKRKNEGLSHLESHSLDINTEAIDILNWIVEKTNVKIVLSSSWRVFGLEVVQECLVDRGFKHALLDRTPSANAVRGAEIRAWLEDKEVLDFVVLDDEMSDIKDFIPARNLFKTSFSGEFLNWSLAEDIVSFLNISE